MVMHISFAYAADTFFSSADTSYLHLSKKSKNSYLKNGLHLTMPPIHPAVVSTVKVNVAKADDKLLNNVQVYPNPVTDQINLKYDISRNSIVTIKVMDLLGNEVITLFSSRVDAGEQKLSYPLNNKLTNGFYFVRLVAGQESVIKRISVL